MTRKGEIIPLDLSTWTDEDQAAIRSLEWRTVANETARAVESSEVFDAPDTTIKRLWRAAIAANEWITKLVRARRGGLRVRIRGSRGPSRRRSKATKPANDNGSGDGDGDGRAPVFIAGLTPSTTNTAVFVDAVADLLVNRLLARYAATTEPT